MSFLVDTNVLSEIRKPNGNRGVRDWFETIRSVELYISVLVIGEIRQGVERLRQRDRRQALVYESWLEVLVGSYGERTLPITAEVADVWGRLNAPNPVPVVDGLLAATATVHGLTLVTRNVDDVSQTGVPLLNPFAPGPD